MSSASDVASDDVHVYAVDFSDNDGRILSAPKNGGMATILATGQAGSGALAVGGIAVYWSNQVDGAIRKVSTAGGPSTTIASSQAYPFDIAVDDTYIYWLAKGHAPAYADGAVLRAPK